MSGFNGVKATAPEIPTEDDISLLCSANPPHAILWASSGFLAFFGFSAAEAIGCDLKIFAGPGTDVEAVQQTFAALSRGEQQQQLTTVSYDKMQRPYRQVLTARRLNSRSGKCQVLRVSLTKITPLSPKRSIEALDTDPHSLFAVAAASGFHHTLQPSIAPVSLPRTVPGSSFVVVTQPQPPFSVVWASQDWLQLCDFTIPCLLGQTLRCIQGPATSKTEVQRMMQAVRLSQPIEDVSLVNYDRMRHPFMHSVSVEPIENKQGKVEFFRASSKDVKRLNMGRTACDNADPFAGAEAFFFPEALAKAASRSKKSTCFPKTDCAFPRTVCAFPEPECEIWGDELEDFIWEHRAMNVPS